MRKTFCYLSLAAMSFATLVPASLSAQSIWLDRSADKTVGLEVLIPNFKDEDGVSGWAAFLSLRAPLSNQLHFVGEMPFAHGSFESRSIFIDSGSQNSIGNPYFGIEIGRQGSPVFGEIGARVPLASEDKFGATLVGLVTDFDRLEAFAPKMLPLTAMLNYHHKEASGFAIRLRGGPSFLINTDKDEFEDGSELFIGYSAQAGYESEQVSILGGVTGRANMTEENADFGERSVHQLGFNASVGLGNVRPGIHFRLPLDDDLKDSMDFVMGFNLGIQLK